MKLLKFVLPIALALCGCAVAPVYAECLGNREPFHNDNLQRDFEVVQDFVYSKRSIPLAEKACNLTIAGDVRVQWANILEKIGNCNLRGRKGHASDVAFDGCDCFDARPVLNKKKRKGIPYSSNAFNIDFNLYIDYVCDRAWCVAWLEFDNIAGINRDCGRCITDPEACQGSGCCDDICLRKAYMGYNVYADGIYRFDLELGRRPLYTVFDSRIEFQARFDGLLAKFARSFECYGDFYVNAGAMVIDERVNHYAWVGETGFMNIMDWGLDLKYSYIDWVQHGRNACGTHGNKGWLFRVSQISATYNFQPEYLPFPTQIYGAFLCNHAARDLFLREKKDSPEKHNFGKQRLGWYAGFTLGKVCHEGDWAFDCNYQVVDAQAIPNCDISGISNGNLLLESFTELNPDFTEKPLSEKRGRGNYRGWYFEGLYAITDNLSLDTTLEFSQAKDSKIGGKHTYSKFEVQAIYAF